MVKIYKVKSRLVLIGIALLALTLAACQTSVAQTPEPTKQPSPTASSYVGQLTLSPASGLPGTVVKAAGTGFTANTKLEIDWQAFRGSWNTNNLGEFHGRDFKDVLQPMGTVETDASGRFETTFTIPEGFGFSHDVLVTKNGTIQNKANLEVKMQASMTPDKGPVGTPITIELKGIGWRSLENSYTLLYDNKFTGWISSITTGGIARFTIPAAGAPGKHIIQIIHGSQTFPYMNMQQSPQPDRPSWTFEFTITEGEPVLPQPAPNQSLPVERGKEPPATGGPTLWTDIVSGPVGTPIILKGSGLPSGEQVELLWFRVKGNRISGQGWDEESTSLGKVTVSPEGEIDFPLKALDDLGGPHRIEARLKGEKVAETSYTITPSAFAVEPASGPAGTIMTIHLKGVGWTETANIYNMVYDNGYLGYACGFNSQGDVTIYLPAAGEPGWHFIDLYPGVYKGEDMKQVNNFRIPQLTAKDDHPGERLPIFRFAFRITEGG